MSGMRLITGIVFVHLGLFSVTLGARGAEHAATPDGVAPTEARGEVEAGNKRFVSGKMKHSHQDAQRRKELSTGQHPHTIVLSCSDSRVPPEVVLDEGLGDIFVVRTAGQAIDDMTVASIEYAVEHLGARHLLVLGHDSCGAIKATLTTKIGESAGSPSLNRLVNHVRPKLSPFTEIPKDDAALVGPGKANVKATVDELKVRSAIVREKIEKKELVVSRAIYHLGTGVVEFFE